MLLKEDDKIFLPKYFYSNKISNNIYFVGNPVSGKSNIIDGEIFRLLMILGKTNISIREFLFKIRKLFDTKKLIKILNKLYKKGILISSGNINFFKFKEDLIILGTDYFNYTANTSIVLNADRIISLQTNCKYYKNIIKIPKRRLNNTKDDSIWINEVSEIIKNNIIKGENLIVISFHSHPLFGGRLPNLLKIKGDEYRFSCRYIPSITYIGNIYNNFFTNEEPMRAGFISIDYNKLLLKKNIDITFQIIITRIGYSKGALNVYKGNWKKLLLGELIILKSKLLEFYDENNIIYIISSEMRKEILLKNIEKGLNYWVPGHTSIFLDSVT